VGIDLPPFLSFGGFRKLKDVEIFKQVKVGFGTIEWPCGVDLDPDFVWGKSIPLREESTCTPHMPSGQISEKQ
jgi:hypothetical protein